MGKCTESAFNYASIIGISQYLQGHIRPDLAFAVSQFTFINWHVKMHITTLTRIRIYLLQNFNKVLTRITQDYGVKKTIMLKFCWKQNWICHMYWQ